jgi:hypothetical protein
MMNAEQDAETGTRHTLIHDRYQIGDEICGQVESVMRRNNALKLAESHFRKHQREGSPITVKVVDLMRHRNSPEILWSYRA